MKYPVCPYTGSRIDGMATSRCAASNPDAECTRIAQSVATSAPECHRVPSTGRKGSNLLYPASIHAVVQRPLGSGAHTISQYRSSWEIHRFEVWILWLLIVGAAPPVGMLYMFRVDVEERFLRQFLPVNGFELLMGDILSPLAATIAGGAFVIFANGFDLEATLLALILIGILSVLLALCGAVALTSRRVLQMRLLATTLSFGALIIGWTSLHSPLAVFGIALMAIIILSGLVATNA